MPYIIDTKNKDGNPRKGRSDKGKSRKRHCATYTEGYKFRSGKTLHNKPQSAMKGLRQGDPFRHKDKSKVDKVGGVEPQRQNNVEPDPPRQTPPTPQPIQEPIEQPLPLEQKKNENQKDAPPPKKKMIFPKKADKKRPQLNIKGIPYDKEEPQAEAAPAEAAPPPPPKKKMIFPKKADKKRPQLNIKGIPYDKEEPQAEAAPPKKKHMIPKEGKHKGKKIVANPSGDMMKKMLEAGKKKKKPKLRFRKRGINLGGDYGMNLGNYARNIHPKKKE